MPVNLTIEDIPDDVVDQLRQRAELNRRSLQDELLALLETAVFDEWYYTRSPGFAEERQPSIGPPREVRRLEEVLERVRALDDERQQEVVQVLLAYLAEQNSDFGLSPEQIAEIERCMSDDEPFASEEEVRSMLERLAK